METDMVIVSEKFTKLMSVFIPVGAITLWPFIIVSPTYNNDITINHEKIHLEQQKELLVVFFYILYVFYWVKGLITYKHKYEAYMHIPFEQEAYNNQNNKEYLLERKRYNWFKLKV